MSENNLGIQPLDQVMTNQGLSNADLVKASTEQLAFKVIQKARKGRRVSPNLQQKILNALKVAVRDKDFQLNQLFNY